MGRVCPAGSCKGAVLLPCLSGLAWWSVWAWELGWLASAPDSTTVCLHFPTCKMGIIIELASPPPG